MKKVLASVLSGTTGFAVIGIGVILAAALLSGCAGVSQSMQYASVKKASFDGFDIFDKPTEQRMLVTASWGMGRAKGLDKANYDPDNFRVAAGSYLARSGRDCAVTSVAVVLAPTNYEARYACGGQ